MHNERMPLYLKIQEHFKDLILKGQLRENDKIPSEKELMKEFQVSRITVANALMQLAKEGWIYRIPGRGSFVSEAIGELISEHRPESGLGGEGEMAPPKGAGFSGHYSLPNDRSVSVMTGGRGVIGFVIPHLVDYFGIRLIQGITEAIEDSPYSLQIVLTYNSIEREKEAINDLIRKGAAGLIIFPCDAETYNEEILSLKLGGFPFVLVDRYLPGVATNIARSDGRVGGQMAVDYLWGLGHRDIAICSDSPLPTITVEDRINGYMEALKQKGAMINPALILTDFSVDYGGLDKRHPLYRFIKNRIATAYITLNGRLGMYVNSLCSELGLRVPGEVSILTFDDPSPGLYGTEHFSHISQSELEMGREAARILLNMLEDGGSKDPDSGYTQVILQPQLIERKTTGPVSQHRS
ncbi:MULTISPECIES: GntR family transcriptional regulator [Paenibacillus]|uniref:GntR family transcriptional regulator n=1 Tax=Paenibacillus TaxID=44249 RepID=UPI002FE0A891